MKKTKIFLSTSPERSRIMSRIKGRGNKSTELVMLSILRRYRIRGWHRHLQIQGTPDFSFPKEKIAIFVDGCFWHGCLKCNRSITKTNSRFWAEKIKKNARRDRKNSRYLRAHGWAVLRFWEHSLKDSQKVASRILLKLKYRFSDLA